MTGVLADIEAVLRDRLVAADRGAPAAEGGRAPAPGSYSATLLADSEQARRKVMEEAFELCLEVGRDPVDRERLAEEAADLVFHALAAVVGAGGSWGDVEAVLERRRGVRRG